jgi:hypothetical protein
MPTSVGGSPCSSQNLCDLTRVKQGQGFLSQWGGGKQSGHQKPVLESSAKAAVEDEEGGGGGKALSVKECVAVDFPSSILNRLFLFNQRSIVLSLL